jgi:hypothetical protein
MTLSLRRVRIRSIAALMGLAIVVTACTQPAGAGSASSAPGGAATSNPAPSAIPTKGGDGY